MTGASNDTLSHILGNPDAADAVDRLVPLIYSDLRALAHRQLAGERAGHTLSTTSLVHEAYLKLSGGSDSAAKGRAYFFGAAARAMRQILVDHARRRLRHKRGGDRERVTLKTELQPESDGFAGDVLELDDALTRLAALAPRQARVVECRYFGGMNVDETAALLEVSARTVKSDWALARAWLHRAMSGEA